MIFSLKSVDCLRGLFYEETIDDIDYKRKVQVQDLGADVKFRDDEIKEPGFIGKKREVGYIPRRSNKHGVQLNR
ncbi:hypothetical protein Bca4012_090299 [Brassica carinata]